MAYTRDKDRHTRGIGAIAAVDSRDPRGAMERRQNMARRFVQHDRAMSALGALNEGGFSSYKAAHVIQALDAGLPVGGTRPDMPSGPQLPGPSWPTGPVGGGGGGGRMPPIFGSPTRGGVSAGARLPITRVGATGLLGGGVVGPITVRPISYPPPIDTSGASAGSLGTGSGGGGGGGGGGGDTSSGMPPNDPGYNMPDPSGPAGLPATIGGYDTKKVLLVAAAAAGAYLLLRKKAATP